jgi:uncharacterized protein
MSAPTPPPLTPPHKGEGNPHCAWRSLGSSAAYLAAIFTLLLTLILPAHALDFPALTGRVVDEAGVLDRTLIDELTQKLSNLEGRTTDQLVVVTLKSLRGTSVEDYGYQLGRHWKIGQKDKNNGVLLIVAPNERKVRFEVGYGLEGTLTDAVARYIIETSIVPRFRSNDVAGGVRRGVDDAIQVLTGAAPEWKQLADQRYGGVPRPGEMPPWPVLIAFCVPIIVLICIFLFMTPAGRWRGRRGDHGYWAPSYGSSGSSSSDFGGGSSGGGFSGGGGSFGGGGASGSW